MEEETFSNFIWIFPLPAGCGLGRQNPVRIGILGLVKWKSQIKVNKVLLSRDVENNTCNYIIDQTNIRNVLAFYQFSKFFSVPNVAIAAFNFIERCFAIVCENEDFLQLDANLVMKVLASSRLHVHSEMEVFDAADSWFNFNEKRREKYANELLLKVRLPLLSGQDVENILKGSSSFTKTKESSDYWC